MTWPPNACFSRASRRLEALLGRGRDIELRQLGHTVIEVGLYGSSALIAAVRPTNQQD